MMFDDDILNGIKEYFDVRELVDKKTFTKYGQKSWQFLDLRMLHCILIIREEIYKGKKVQGMDTGLPITANTWLWGGDLDERGLRTNICDTVKGKTDDKTLYLSAHVQGKALDFDVKGMTAIEVREWIVDNHRLFPYKLRLEDKKKDRDKNSKTYGQMIPISWVHLDVYWLDKNPKVYLFDV
jgi:hypothetical protein